MCMGHDFKPQIVHISIAVKADSPEDVEKSKSLARTEKALRFDILSLSNEENYCYKGARPEVL